MSFALLSVSIFTSQLEAVLTARSDLSALPFGSVDMRANRPTSGNMISKVKMLWNSAMLRLRIFLESWTGPHDDKRISWTLGIGWACCGGGLAGGCLVFAKAG
jgi:magnesium transporter